jgi:tetratricopeptide (TPR) repeat protein/predicted Ser/Thr protein kinase
MTPERWARVKEVFQAALEQEAERRTAFIADATAGDEPLRAEVERLLAADRHAAHFIETPAAAMLLSGHVISHYEIGQLLGSGGMGQVYAARDTDLGREVALKVASLHSPDAQARLKREAQHASRLSHPNICHIYEVGRADGQPFVVMERVHGRSLADVINEGPLPIGTATRYGIEIADALAHAHERGVTHRDLKSTNVMVTTRGVKVLDFGLAKILDTHEIDALSQSHRSLTSAGMIPGTLPYMAPELLRGQRGDQRADIWALGVLLHEMVSGRRPFTGATGFELSAAILHQLPEPLPPAVPEALAAIIRRCLAKNPDERYQQAADVHRALEDLKDGTGAVRIPTPSRAMRIAMTVLVVAIAIVVVRTVWDPMSTVVSEQIPIVEEGVSNARGYSLLQDGEFARALEQFQSISAREPDDANAWDSLGEGYLASGMPDKSLDAYSRALRLSPGFHPSLLGRVFALAAAGRYDEALTDEPPDFRAQAFVLSRVGRYREAVQVIDKARADLPPEDTDENAGARVMLAWLSLERKQYPRALDELRAARAVGPERDEPDSTLLVLDDLIGGITEIQAGNLPNAVSRLDALKLRYDRDERIESNWVAALEGEVALAQRQYDRALASFRAAERPTWVTLNQHVLAIFATSSPSRDGKARVEAARGNRAAAIAEYRRLTAAGPGGRTAALEPRHVLALARLLEASGDRAAARVEYGRFLQMWVRADEDLPELAEAQQALARLSRSS